jgi:hypothetical protein
MFAYICCRINCVTVTRVREIARKLSFYLFFSFISMHLHRSGKTNTFVSQIKLSVINTHENISKNPEGSNFGREIQAQETTDALCLIFCSNLEDVLLRGEGECLACKHKANSWHGGDLKRTLGFYLLCNYFFF